VFLYKALTIRRRCSHYEKAEPLMIEDPVDTSWKIVRKGEGVTKHHLPITPEHNKQVNED